MRRPHLSVGQTSVRNGKQVRCSIRCEETARRTTESDGTYVGRPRGRYKKRREGSYGHPRGKGYQRSASTPLFALDRDPEHPTEAPWSVVCRSRSMSSL